MKSDPPHTGDRVTAMPGSRKEFERGGKINAFREKSLYRLA